MTYAERVRPDPAQACRRGEGQARRGEEEESVVDEDHGEVGKTCGCRRSDDSIDGMGDGSVCMTTKELSDGRSRRSSQHWSHTRGTVCITEQNHLSNIKHVSRSYVHSCLSPAPQDTLLWVTVCISLLELQGAMLLRNTSGLRFARRHEIVLSQ